MSKTNHSQPIRRDTLRYVLSLLNRHLPGQRQAFVLAIIMLLAEATTSIFEAYPLAYLIDFLKGDRPDLLTRFGFTLPVSPTITTVALLTTGLILMAMINSLGDSMAEIYLARGGRMLGYNLRTALYSHLQRLSLAFHDQRRTGDILTRLTGDVSEVEDFVISSLSDIVGSTLVLVGTIVFLSYNSWQVALVAVVIIPIMALVSNYFAQRIKVAAKKQRARQGDLASATEEMLTSIRVIQTYSRHEHDLKRFADYNQKNVEAALLAAGLQARFSWVVRVLEAVAISAVVWLGLWLINQTTITVGMLLMFIVMIQNMFKPTRKIIKEWNTIGKIYASVERIGELLDRKASVYDAPDAVVAPTFRGAVAFHNVCFAYQPDLGNADQEETTQTRQALQDVSFQVEPGQVLALVGHTGAGKSTIIQLLPRLYDPSAGRILIDGQDIRHYTLESLRDQISVVLQETILFNGTVADNIAYGRTSAKRSEIIEAAIQANAHEFIDKLPNGYDTILGERGANLSGGQRQRIAIARAIIRNTPILILDEPTTGLDADSSELVLLALRTLMKAKTTIIISHDFKLVRQADKIVVLKAGQIQEMGNHHELMLGKGLYANLYTKQFGEAVHEEDRPGSNLFDLLNNPLLQQKLPSLAQAFDAETMRHELQVALFGNHNEAYEIEQCTPGKAVYLGDEGCQLRYDLAVKNKATGQLLASIVLARIFPNIATAEIYLRERLLPMVTQLAGRADLLPFATPVALLYAQTMVVHVFPIDAELPVLVKVTDRQLMHQVFSVALPDAVSNQFVVEDCFVEPGHYGRQHRCVLRYEIEGKWVNSNLRGRQIVYGKVAADRRGELVGPVLTALHKRLQQSSNAYQFTLPRLLAYRPDLHLVLLEAIAGEARLGSMLKAHVQGKAAAQSGGLTVERALDDCARVLATLHQSNIPLGPARTLVDDLAELQAPLWAMRQISPALAVKLQDGLKRLRPYLDQEPLSYCLCHGDYSHTQLLFTDTGCGLVDFDTVCQAEPALDLGQFLAYLRLAVLKAHKGGETASTTVANQLCERFLNTYLIAAGYYRAESEQLHSRASVYEVVSLLRLAQHSWQKLKESRLEQVILVLEERIPCLPPLQAPLNLRKAPLPWLGGAPSRRPLGLKQR